MSDIELGLIVFGGLIQCTNILNWSSKTLIRTLNPCSASQELNYTIASPNGQQHSASQELNYTIASPNGQQHSASQELNYTIASPNGQQHTRKLQILQSTCSTDLE